MMGRPAATDILLTASVSDIRLTASVLTTGLVSWAIVASTGYSLQAIPPEAIASGGCSRKGADQAVMREGFHGLLLVSQGV